MLSDTDITPSEKLFGKAKNRTVNCHQSFECPSDCPCLFYPTFGPVFTSSSLNWICELLLSGVLGVANAPGTLKVASTFLH